MELVLWEKNFLVFLSEGERQGYINEGFLGRVVEGGGAGLGRVIPLIGGSSCEEYREGMKVVLRGVREEGKRWW